MRGKRKLDPVFAMAMAYETILGEYRLKPTLRWVNRYSKLDPASRVYKTLKEAAEIADEIKVSYEDFCRAQFYWVHRRYRRPANPYELRGRTGDFPAKERYEEYKRRVDSGEIAAKVESSVIQKSFVTDQELDRINQDRLERLMAAWNLNAEECIERFGPSGLFDFRWLTRNPIFKQLRKENRV